MSPGIKEKAERWARPLRAHLSAVIVLLLIGVAAPLIWLSYERGKQAAIYAAGAEMRTQADRIVDRYRELFRDARLGVGILSAAQTFLTLPSDDVTGKADLLFAALKETTYLDGIYVGYPNGAFIHAVELTNDPTWRQALSAPKDAVYALRVNLPGEGEEWESTWRFLDGRYQTVAVDDTSPTDYDPRKRVWYRLATETRRPVVSPPYVFATTKAQGVTISESHLGNPNVVIGADVILGRLSRFLADEKISPGAKSYVFDRSGRLIVHSDPEVMVALLGELSRGNVDPARLAARDAAYAPVRALLEGAVTPDRQVEISVDGRPYFVHLARIANDPLLEGTAIAVAAPLSDFTGASERLLREGAAVSVFLLLIGVFIAFLASRLVSRSMQQLTCEASRLGELDFTASEPVDTHITEIRALNRAIDSAREAIHAFALYVPRELVRKIVHSGGQESRSGARQDVTVLFTDIKGFTAISEHNTPEAVVAMLSRYFDVVNRGVERHQGTIIQYLGDSVYAMWNAPVVDPDHAAHACACALDLKDSIEDFNAAQRTRGEPELATRFGIHTGPAVVGSVGAAERLQYTAMGDTVNVASRLEGINKEFGTTIIVSRSVRDQCAGRFAFRSLGVAKAKGREEAIEVFELTGRVS